MILLDHVTYDVAIVEGIAPLPGKATLVVDTTPVKGEVFINDISQGIAPVTLEVDPGSYTLSFGNVEGYHSPEDTTITLAEDDIITVTGEYTPIAAPVSIPWSIIGAGAIIVGVLYIAAKK